MNPIDALALFVIGLSLYYVTVHAIYHLREWWFERKARRIEGAIVHTLIESGLAPYLQHRVVVIHDNGVPASVTLFVRPERRRELAQSDLAQVANNLWIPTYPDVDVTVSWHGRRVGPVELDPTP